MAPRFWVGIEQNFHYFQDICKISFREASTIACSIKSCNLRMAKEVKTAITIEQAINLIGKGRAQFIILSLTAGGYLAVCSEILVCVFSQEPCSKNWGVSKQGFAWLFFITAFASVIGGLISGYVSDKYGRQLPFIIALGTSGCFGLASAFADSFWSFIFLR